MRNMLRFVLFFSLILCPLVICKRKHNKEKDSSASDLGGKLVTDLRDDANLDLSADEEYEDLRAELLAYHTALASLTNTRRSMKTTPCWKIGGICIPHKMCEGHRSLSEVAGCRDKLEVCCFTWNRYQIRDMTDKGIGLPMPWSPSKDFGGKGVVGPFDAEPPKKQKKKALESDEDLFADPVRYKKQEIEPPKKKKIDPVESVEHLFADPVRYKKQKNEPLKKKNPVESDEDLYADPSRENSLENTNVVIILQHMT